MSASCDTTEELRELLGALREDVINDSQAGRLVDILQSSSAARRTYIHYMALIANIRGSTPDIRDGFPALLSDNWPVPPAESGEKDDKRRETTMALQDPSALDSCSSPSPAPAFLPVPSYGTTNYFADGWPVAYLLAAVILGLGIVAAAVTYVSQPVHVASALQVQKSRSVPEPNTPCVGRITGMVDCRWTGGSRVSLGQKCELASGLMEITYDTGAKVILQGPVTYSVEANGGYLAVGKLTGKLEKTNDECRMINDELRIECLTFILHPSSFILSLSALPPPL